MVESYLRWFDLEREKHLVGEVVLTSYEVIRVEYDLR